MRRFKVMPLTLAPIVALMTVFAASAQAPVPTAPAMSAKPSEGDLAAHVTQRLALFSQDDRRQSPPKDAIVIVGSSIFEQWATLKEDLSPLPVFNRAIGGTKTDQQLQYIDRLALQYRPRVIVYYCGSNDVNDGVSATAIANNFKQYVERVAKALPTAQIIVASILRAPQKQALWDVVNEANAKLKTIAATHPRITYVDINPAVFDLSGAPRLDLYQDDQLHYRPQAYPEFARIIKPVLQAAWQP